MKNVLTRTTVMALSCGFLLYCKQSPPTANNTTPTTAPTSASQQTDSAPFGGPNFVPILPVLPNHGPRGSGRGPVWDEPQGWQRVEPTSMMRRAQYRIPHAENDSVDGELTVSSFGGSLDANVQRWLSQVTRPDGTPVGETAPRVTFTANGYRVTIVESGPGRVAASPRVMVNTDASAPVMPTLDNGRLLGAVVESPTNNSSQLWFFKLTGPDATVTQARATFEAMLRSVHPPPLQ